MPFFLCLISELMFLFLAIFLSSSAIEVIVFLMLCLPGVLILRLLYMLLEAILLYHMPLKERYREILIKDFPYYQNLPKEGKRRFERKLIFFKHKNKFEGRKKLEITDRMLVLISASAAQLTYGLRDLRFTYFGTITIFPRRYMNNRTRRMHEGEVNMRDGMIVLSWEDALKGIKNPRDGRNLVLHEMAHALRLEDMIANDEYHFLKERYTREFDRVAEEMVKSGGDSSIRGLFRKYALTNKDEFFAVAVEVFFERPSEFRVRIPDLYHMMSRLLNQDPASMMELA